MGQVATEDNTNRIREDILTIVGGHFTPKALGRELYEEIVGRTRADSKKYLDEFAAMFVGTKFDAVSQVDLLLATFLQLLQGIDPEGVKTISERLLRQYDAVLTVYDATTDRAALHQLLPEDTVRLMQRFASRRAELQELMKFAP